MLKKINAFLAPPHYEDLNLQRRAHISHIVLLIVLALAPPMAVAAFVIGAVGQGIGIVGLVVITTFTYVLTRRGQLVWASRLFLLVVALIITLLVTFTGGGLSSPGYVVFFFGIVLSGFTGTGRLTIAFTLFAIFIAIAVTLLEMNGLLPSQGTQIPLLLRMTAYLVLLSLTGATVYVVSQTTDRDIYKLATLNRQNARLVETVTQSNARLEEAARSLQKQNAYLATLHETTLALMDRLALPEVLQSIVIRAGAIFDTPNGYVYLKGDGNTLALMAGSGHYQDQIGQQINIEQGLIGQVFISSAPLIVEEAIEWPERFRQSAEVGEASAIAIPLRGSHGVLGVIGITRDASAPPFTTDDIPMLTQFAELASIALDNARLYTAAHQELAERKAAEESLQRYQRMMEASLDGIVLLIDENLGSVNEATATIFGYDSPDELIGQTWWMLYSTEERMRLRAVAGARLEAAGHWRGSAIGHRKDGTVFPHELAITQIREGELVCSIRDVTQQMQAAQALMRSESTTQALLDAIPDLVTRYNRNGDFLDIHIPMMFDLTLSAEQLIGRNVRATLPPDIAEQIIHYIEVALTQGGMPSFEYYSEITNRYFEARFRAISDDEVVCITRNVSERRDAEDRLREAHKLESLGVLAGGIAHDFNNLLTGVLAQTSLVVAQLPENDPLQANVMKAMRAAERAADLTRQLLAYAGKGQFFVDALDLNRHIREYTSLLETAVSRFIDIEFKLAANLPLINADVGQVQQVLTNLIINAAEAMEDEGGVIELITDAVTLSSDNAGDVPFINNWLPPAGRYVSLQVSDTGPGIPQDTLRRMFDPFFSTKSNGRGLGLSSTLGIIRTHQGGMQVISEAGRGTTFRIYFPVRMQANSAEAIKPDGPVALTGCVLIIDDEAPVREAVEDILSLAGLEVVVADNGLAGIDRFEEQPSRFSCVLLDMKMPGIDGGETLRRLQAISPAVKVIISSGYSEAELSDRDYDTRHVTFFQKPYTFDGLTNTIQQLLQTPA